MDTQKHTATLVRGENYVVANRSGRDDFTFPKGVPVVIDDTLKAILDEHAFDDVAGEVDAETGEVEVFSKAKFSFDTYEGNLPVGAVASGASAAKARKVIPATAKPARRRAQQEA